MNLGLSQEENDKKIQSGYNFVKMQKNQRETAGLAVSPCENDHNTLSS